MTDKSVTLVGLNVWNAMLGPSGRGVSLLILTKNVYFD